MSNITVCTVSSVKRAAQELKLSNELITGLLDKLKKESGDVSAPDMMSIPTG